MSMKIEAENLPPKLYIRKFPYNAQRADLVKYFSQFGSIKEIDFKNSTGFLEYVTSDAFEACLNAEHIFEGAKLIVDTGYDNFNKFNYNNNHRNEYGQNNYNIAVLRDNCRYCSNCPDHGFRAQKRIKSDSLKLVLENIPPVEGAKEVVDFLGQKFGYNINFSKLVKDNKMCIVEYVDFNQKHDALSRLKGVDFKGNNLTVRNYSPPKENFGQTPRHQSYERQFYNKKYQNDRTEGVDLYGDMNNTRSL